LSDKPPAGPPEQEQPAGLLARHPKLGILLIAGLFYVILFGMCAFVVVLVWFS
jgi:hypothetical protein